MNSISTFGSITVAYSGQNSRTVNNQTEQPNVAKSKAVLTGDNIERQVVEISQEALTKFQEYTAKQKADNAGSEQLRTAEGARVGQSGRLSEEEQTGLMEAMAADSLAEYLRVANETWGNLSAVTKQMDQTYSSFLDQLAEDHPDLKGAFFGFSVNKDGTLFVTQSEGLDREQIDRLEKALNGSDALVSLANDLADAQIAVFNAQRGFNTQQTLNRDNYGQTIDMGIDILTRHLARSAPRDGSASEIHQRNWDSNWYNQL
ncbi:MULTISPECIES: hypothetical protein [Pectobacterium]|uniref:hypothetical protein n=1 Tax=Pectobacterium TaxID=122277 RepID=UPI000E250177|nr:MULTISPECIES: hypothetical protein [Pectobacterium]GKV82039.1 hypothetical protein PEC106664_28130 [Pectobacterium carotovorum subsp. carotovorum]MCL6373019.1 hypothetical protein [Pectobacterium atrosepticum]RRN98196.1 hypothetical protein DMB79_004360 [Pectobacterium aquaticum]RUR90015.1 hypothetical protein PB16LOC_03663 [Pectobacterium versatile]UCP82229.1 hypothetical protein LGL95_02650 [Pectobacterium versatile]